MAIAISRTSATKALLAQIQAALDDKMQKFITDTQTNMPINNYALFAGGASPLIPSSTLGQRAAIIARMDMMRSAFPQSFAEMVPPPPTSLTPLIAAFQGAGTISDFENAVCNVLSQGAAPNGGTSSATMPPSGTATAPILSPYPSHQNLLVNYLVASGQISSAGAFAAQGGYLAPHNPNSPFNQNAWSAVPFGYAAGQMLANNTLASAHDPETESSECLYLILADKSDGIESILDSLPAQFIKDTDGDGLMEIVDSWGKPVKFYRWATDTFAYFIEVTQQYKGIGKPGDINADGIADTILNSNSLDPNNLLYIFMSDIPPSGLSWFLTSPSGSINSISPDLKDIFECLFGRLHGAYDYASYSNSNVTLLTPLLNTDPNAIAFNATDGRIENNASSSGISGVSLAYSLPRSYPFRSLVVSAGSDGEFGMYNLQSITPSQPSGAVTYPQIHIGFRCGRVEDDLTKPFLCRQRLLHRLAGGNQAMMLSRQSQKKFDTRPTAKTLRAGVTLVELLTVMGIMILLAAIAIPTIFAVIRGDKLRDASSSVQGFITAARERAALEIAHAASDSFPILIIPNSFTS